LSLLFLMPLLAWAAAAPRRARSPTSTKTRRREFERALKKSDAALKKAKDAAETAKLQLARGQALLALGENDKARAAFSAALKADPTAELDASRASPDAVRVFEKARSELPATVSITVPNGSASIIIDDKDMGPAPLQSS